MKIITYKISLLSLIFFLFFRCQSRENFNEINLIDQTLPIVLDSIFISKPEGKLIIADSTYSSFLDKNHSELYIDFKQLNKLHNSYDLENWDSWDKQNRPTDNYIGILVFSRITFSDSSGTYSFLLNKAGDSGVEGTVWLKKTSGNYYLLVLN
ncbi:hypothetical protein [Chondrinema litorale]|uniref:hypothetical protein n=1 Tax=Chondrinema litorale TaxID=2994555 RepID=UPI0025428F84|nr:hypothetical protein [Chondrinema litorale]UZR94079.1 hypothetical protein OQ292_19745 [Chondrinema litorale]